MGRRTWRRPIVNLVEAAASASSVELIERYEGDCVRRREAVSTAPPAASAPNAARVSGRVELPVRARSTAATVSVSASTDVPPQLTESVTLPEAPAGIVAGKLNVPVEVAVPEPTCVPPTDADTAPPFAAPDPLTVTVWPAEGVVSDTVAAQPP